MKFNHLTVFLLVSGIIAGCTDEKVVLPELSDVPTVNPEGETGTRPYDNSFEMPDEMPILAWIGVPPGYTSEEHFTLLKECGFNINYYNYNGETNVKNALEIANKVGIQILPQWNSGWLNNPDKYVPLYDSDPALFGYFITDEPQKKNDFSTYKGYMDAIKAAGATKPCYINFISYTTQYNYENWGFQNAQEYLDTCIDTFDPPFISFDKYPLTLESDGSITRDPNWFECMEMFRETSIRTGKPLWAFVRCGSNDHRPIPTVENMRLLANVDLAYGAQAIEYYTYWQAGGNNPDSCITLDGDVTDTYYMVQQVNGEIRELEPYFYKGTVTKVVHVTTEFEDITINSAPEGAIGSLLTSREGKNYISLVNKSFLENMSVTRNGVDYEVLPGGLLLLDR